jgi:hypothetical protein
MSDQEIQPASEKTTGLTQWQRVTNIFSAPSATFADIQRGNRSWWLPFLIFAIVGYMFFAAVAFKVGMKQVVDNQFRLDPKASARMEQATPAQREMSTKISLYVTEGIFAGSPVLVLAGTALLSLGLLGTINFVFAGKATFPSIFAVWMYASLPSVIKTLLGTAVLFAGAAPESFNIKNFAPTNIAALFLSPTDTNHALYTLATSLDFVSIWTMVLLAIGTAKVAGVKRSSGFMAVFGWWIIFVLFSAGIAAITS